MDPYIFFSDKCVPRIFKLWMWDTISFIIFLFYKYSEDVLAIILIVSGVVFVFGLDALKIFELRRNTLMHQ